MVQLRLPHRGGAGERQKVTVGVHYGDRVEIREG